MTLSNRFKTLAICTLALTPAFTQPVVADSQTIAVASQKQVRISDLNLNHPAGLNALYQRLSSASRDVCGNFSDLKSAGSVKQMRARKACFEQTLATALAEVNFPENAQAHAFQRK